MSWDGNLPYDLEVKFMKWIYSTRCLCLLVIDRHYFPLYLERVLYTLRSMDFRMPQEKVMVLACTEGYL